MASLSADRCRQGIELSTGAAAERQDQLDQADHLAHRGPRAPLTSAAANVAPSTVKELFRLGLRRTLVILLAC